MTRAFIAVGSNIDQEINIERALERLNELVPVRAISDFYSTRALSGGDQADFLNGMVEVETDLPALALKESVLRSIEDELGRRRSEDKNADRTIDLDLVLYGDVMSETPPLVLPDPELGRRAFLAVPLMQLAPTLELPGGRGFTTDLAMSLDRSGMLPKLEYSHRLRTRILHGPQQSRNAH
ncbi:MAG: 2-amino-4-hydroxy-6-hydroxymethyldihydropteridine diphosphokinase [Polyangiaceae bacterium]|nr:2-amino-4-hydroxy-6-hydroxymethyldihydropteridine diphosphokinase [Polyangiaceae bacterium]